MTKRKALVVAGLLTSLYAVLALTVPVLAFIDLLNGIFVGVMLAVIIVYFPVFYKSLKSQTFDRTAQLAVGIGLIWASLAIARVYSAWLFASGKNGGFLLSPVGGFAIFLAIIGGALHITAPGYPADSDPPLPVAFAGRNRWLLLFSGVTGGIVALLLRIL
jgi:hypothetical protein